MEEELNDLTVRVAVMEELLLSLAGGLIASTEAPAEFREALVADVRAAFERGRDNPAARAFAAKALAYVGEVEKRLKAASGPQEPAGRSQ